MKNALMIIISLLIFRVNLLPAQNISVDDSLNIRNLVDTCNSHQFKTKQLILPVAMIGIGAIGVENGWLKSLNRSIRDELQRNIDNKFTIDDFSQYVPMVSVYALNLCGLKGKHNFHDRTIILAISALLMGTMTNGLKYTMKVMRPDGSCRNSFPSGHTAMAFMGAEFLRKEYNDVSPWIGVAGYAVAAGTGFFRMYNNRHWFNDVLAGAGIGILSTRTAYWVYPSLKKILFKKKRDGKENTTMLASPFISDYGKGLSFVVQLYAFQESGIDSLIINYEFCMT